jgi:hypothetical protein
MDGVSHSAVNVACLKAMSQLTGSRGRPRRDRAKQIRRAAAFAAAAGVSIMLAACGDPESQPDASSGSATTTPTPSGRDGETLNGAPEVVSAGLQTPWSVVSQFVRGCRALI